jgi:hypothetical protein
VAGIAGGYIKAPEQLILDGGSYVFLSTGILLNSTKLIFLALSVHFQYPNKLSLKIASFLWKMGYSVLRQLLKKARLKNRKSIKRIFFIRSLFLFKSTLHKFPK